MYIKIYKNENEENNIFSFDPSPVYYGEWYVIYSNLIMTRKKRIRIIGKSKKHTCNFDV